jgi:MFS family permease
MLSIPILSAMNALEVWHVYLVAIVFGALMMISLAGSPAMVPDLVPAQALPTANALEMLGFTGATVLGPLLAGVLIEAVGVANVVLLDVVTYAVFALALVMMGPVRSVVHDGLHAGGHGLRPAIELLLGNRILLVTTTMYLLLNLGGGMLQVALPVYVDEHLGGEARLFGLLLGVSAIGEMAVAALTGIRGAPARYGISIGVCQAICGFTVLLLLPEVGWLAGVGLLISGAASGPLTIWAQTLRMQIIPPHLRGRTFALLRTLMQGGRPVGGIIGGVALPVIGMSALLFLAASIMGGPGIAGLSSRHLREDDFSSS